MKILTFKNKRTEQYVFKDKLWFTVFSQTSFTPAVHPSPVLW